MMKSFLEKIYFHRDKDENSEIVSKAKRIKFEQYDDLRYLGYEIEMVVIIAEDGTRKIKEVCGINVEDKEILI